MAPAPTREETTLHPQDAGIESVSALWDLPGDSGEPPSSPRPPILLAHGAGVPMRSEFMETIAVGIAAGGHPVLRFNYPYAERMEQSGTRRPPDRRGPLMAAHRCALAKLTERFPEPRPVLAGKSMGGRIASMLAAEGDDAASLVFFGYPLHPPGKPEKQRTEHFPTLAQPALFLQGDRDALAGLDLLRTALETYGGQSTLEVIEGADHDFAVLRRMGLAREEVLAGLVERTLAWIAGRQG